MGLLRPFSVRCIQYHVIGKYDRYNVIFRLKMLNFAIRGGLRGAAAGAGFFTRG